MPYSRANPSPRYQELTGVYRRSTPRANASIFPPQDTFPGLSLPPQAGRVKRLIERYRRPVRFSTTAAGKGRQYDVRNFKADDGRGHESQSRTTGTSTTSSATTRATSRSASFPTAASTA